MVKEKWVPSLFVVYIISIQVLVWCVVGEEGGTNKPTEKNGGKSSRSSGTRNSAWGGGFVGYGGGNGGCSGGYVYENGRWSCANSDHTGGVGGGYGVSIGDGGGGGGARYEIGDGTGNGNAASDYGGGSVGGRAGNVGGGSAGVGVGGGEVGVGVGNNGGGGGGNGGGVGVGIGIGIGVGGGGYSGFVTPGVSGQPFFCTPLSCSNGQCNRLASNLGVEPFQEKETRPSAQENNDQDRSYQNVAPAQLSLIIDESFCLNHGSISPVGGTARAGNALEARKQVHLESNSTDFPLIIFAQNGSDLVKWGVKANEPTSTHEHATWREI